ncbi:RND family efflux transporter MFP subunit [Peteryoungia aggregata LMG 23059]|uniref:RND family efflux transporter MFP subunit n=1 Tax=Peteryoungia aggregata LMG 23059 TaxID=1368425 RepID=A0ABU0G2E7_9HYPH|nr:efflux RND transporter periplasmic adaptor subunit [Peteryoungia aggregata]MDQ0419487.1 RND family efflux transporter MFP subunit [Peteryoungia aggregata LMG 23059]
MHHHRSKTRALALLGSLLAALPVHSADQDPVRTVVFAEVKADHSDLLRFAGTIQPRVEADLAFRTFGRIIRNSVQVGDIVKRDDILMELDPLTAQLAVRSAQAEVRSAEAQLENARIVANRNQILVSSRSASQADLEVAEQALIAAQANLDRAQASLQKANQQLGYTTLRADFDGAITRRNADVGETVAVGQAVLELARLDQRDAVIDVPESLLEPLRNSQKVQIDLQLDPTVSVGGSLREIAPDADPTTRSYRVKIALDDAPVSFRLGSVVSVSLTNVVENAEVTLPSSAVFSENGISHVWRIEPETNQLKKTEVTVVAETTAADTLRILAGLSRGDRIVVTGVDQLKDGQVVKLGQERRT